MIYLILILAFFIVLGLIDYSRSKRKRYRHIQTILAYQQLAQNHLGKVAEVNSAGGQVKYFDKALNALKAAGRYPECREIIDDYDRLTRKIKSVKKVLPIYEEIRKANEHRSAGNDASEKDSLVTILQCIKNNSVTDEDFMIAGMGRDAALREIRIDNIINRLEELGRAGA